MGISLKGKWPRTGLPEWFYKEQKKGLEMTALLPRDVRAKMGGSTKGDVAGGQELWELCAGQDEWRATFQERDCAREDKAWTWRPPPGSQISWRDAGGMWEWRERDSSPLAVQPRALLVSMLGDRRHR